MDKWKVIIRGTDMREKYTTRQDSLEDAVRVVERFRSLENGIGGFEIRRVKDEHSD